MRGESGAFDYLYTKVYSSVERFVVTNSGSQDDAVDLFQETMTAVWINIRQNKFNPTAVSFGAYVLRIARNKWIDRLCLSDVRRATKLGDEAIDIVEHPAGEAEEHEAARLLALSAAFDTLGEKCQTILTAFYYRKDSLAAIGEQLNHDESTVRTLKCSCMSKLRAALAAVNHRDESP